MYVLMGDVDDRWQDCPEATLVAAARENRDAFAELYRRYRPRVFSYLLTYAATVEDAADLTQHVFLRVLETLPSYQPRGVPFAAWLFRIARNAATDAYRRRRRVLPWDHLPEHLYPLAPDDPVAQTIRAEDLNQMRVLIARLGEDRQELLALRFASGLSLAEMALVVGKQEGTVRKQLTRTIQRLKEEFRDLDP